MALDGAPGWVRLIVGTGVFVGAILVVNPIARKLIPETE